MRFQPGEGPSRGLLCDCENRLWNLMEHYTALMAGQTVLVELVPGDRVQLYMYTFTGLHDKKANHLTQFVGFLVSQH